MMHLEICKKKLYKCMLLPQSTNVHINKTSLHLNLVEFQFVIVFSTVPPRLRLKLTAHICILALHICRFTVDIDSLRLSLGSSIALSK